MTVLNNDIEMPIIGLGTWQINSQQVITTAISAGYRHIDTAAIYHNESATGEGMRASDVPRDEIFITTKLWNSDHGYDAALRAFEASLERLGTDYVDLYLIHWPSDRKLIETWQALETIYERGQARAIGVSNYGVSDLEKTIQRGDVTPAVNQIELHPYNIGKQQPTIDFCREHNIAVEAYSPLVKGRRLNDPNLVTIAERYDKSTAQILIRWGIQQEFITIPKSNNPIHIRANIDVFDFEISEADMKKITQLGR